MSFNYNRVTLAGNLTRDPESRAAGNSSVASFGLAVNRKFKGPDGQQKEETTFVDVEAWGRTAELVVQYLRKGSGCFVEGRLRLDQWEDKQSGEKRAKLKVVAESVQFLGGRREHDAEGAEAGAAAPSRPPQRPAPAAGDDEPPF